MIRDVIERFSYRFRLWRREQLENYAISIPRADEDKPDYLSFYVKHPKYIELVTESTLKSVGRLAGAYFGIIVLASQFCLMAGMVVPTLRFTLGVVFLTFAILWTFITIFGEFRLRKARKQYREQQKMKSSNRTMQLTVGRSDNHVSVHESAFRPAMPRPRQR